MTAFMLKPSVCSNNAALVISILASRHSVSALSHGWQQKDEQHRAGVLSVPRGHSWDGSPGGAAPPAQQQQEVRLAVFVLF